MSSLRFDTRQTVFVQLFALFIVHTDVLSDEAFVSELLAHGSPLGARDRALWRVQWVMRWTAVDEQLAVVRARGYCAAARRNVRSLHKHWTWIGSKTITRRQWNRKRWSFCRNCNGELGKFIILCTQTQEHQFKYRIFLEILITRNTNQRNNIRNTNHILSFYKMMKCTKLLSLLRRGCDSKKC